MEAAEPAIATQVPVIAGFERPAPPAPSRAVWGAAIAAAILLHLCGAASLIDWRGRTLVEAGASGSEIAVELVAPEASTENASPDPPSPEAAAAEESHDRPETPLRDPDPLPKQADAVLDMPQIVEPPSRPPSSASAAAKASAPPPNPAARRGERSTTPVQGTGASMQRAEASWQRDLVSHLDRYKRYPPGLRQAAEVRLGFSVDRTGHVHDARIISSSGNPSYDEEALAMLHRADPLPRPPQEVPDSALTFIVPVNFRAVSVR